MSYHTELKIHKAFFFTPLLSLEQPAVIPFQGSILMRAGDAKILQLNKESMTWELRPEKGTNYGQIAIIAAKLC